MNKRRRLTVILAVTVIAAGIAQSAVGALVDMTGHWAAPLIAALEARGIVSGDIDGRFNPDAPLTRAQLAKILVTGLGDDAEAQLLTRYDSRFSDVPSWHWAKGYIESLAESDVTQGYPDGTFNPAGTVTRAEMALFLVRMLGLNDDARKQQLRPTAFADDPEIPGWARGAVQVAVGNGVMNGNPDGKFHPQAAVTRAEGTVALLRTLVRLGRAYDLVGTLVSFDPEQLQGVVRDRMGRDHPFIMAQGAQYYQDGMPVPAAQARPADQVWLVLGVDGKSRLMDEYYADLLGANAVINNRMLTLTTSGGEAQTFRVQDGAFIFLNGRAASLQDVQGASQVYVSLDSESRDARTVDAVNAPIRGSLVGINQVEQKLFINADGGTKTFSLSAGAILFLNGRPVGLMDLRTGDQMEVAVDQTGAITYLQAQR